MGGGGVGVGSCSICERANGLSWGRKGFPGDQE